jgi:adenine-specific DNA-methyltransferase
MMGSAVKLYDEVHPNKLRGGFYTEPHVVEFCLQQVKKLHEGWPERWLEPSAGDGAFIRGMGDVLPAAARRHSRLHAVELIDSEAAKCEAAARRAGIEAEVINESFFEWASRDTSQFDAVVGNPPYVRYQFVGESDRLLAERLVGELGITLRGVSNLWIPFALLSLARLREGGCFSLVLPSELFCTSSGGQFRTYLVQHFTSLEIDLFPRGTFPDILQDVVVVSGRKAVRPADARPVRLTEHTRTSRVVWGHRVEANGEPWLRYLLSEREHAAFVETKSLRGFHSLGNVARLEVAIVTGANTFFTVPDSTVAEYGLQPWAIPLLARTSDAPGVVFTEADHAEARRRGSRAWLLDFSADRPKPNGHGRVSEYLAAGIAQGLPDRYKCRIREPWYRVPHIKRGVLMMTKRAHHYHRLLLNAAAAYTTDTIYRGDMRPLFAGRERDLVAAFQNTLTLLSSEVEGRTYGGGVLELVPSEVARLAVPLVETRDLLARVDAISRSVNGQKDSTHAVMQTTDEFLCREVPGYREVLPLLDSARRRLQAKRHDLQGSDEEGSE